MKRRETEIAQWSEIFCNEKYKEISSLHDIIENNKEVLKQLLSIRIPIYRKNLDEQSINQYNIETEKYITNITTHNGLDLHIMQYTKANKRKQIYSPYSNPWYNVYVYLLCAYYECFRKKPILNFSNTDADIEWWNKQIRSHDVPLMNDMMATSRDSGVYSYLHQYQFFQQDNNWIYRIISPISKNKEREEEGIGIQGNEVILQCKDYYYNAWSKHKIYIEKELINLFLQAFIDVNRATSWSINNLNLRKITDITHKVLENSQIREDSNKLNIGDRFEEFKK